MGTTTVWLNDCRPASPKPAEWRAPIHEEMLTTRGTTHASTESADASTATGMSALTPACESARASGATYGSSADRVASDDQCVELIDFPSAHRARLASAHSHALSASTTDSSFSALIDSLRDNEKVFVPAGVDVTLYQSHAFTKPVLIDGPGTLVDGRPAPTTPFLIFEPGSDGSVGSARLRGSVAGQYIEDHDAIRIQGLANGAGIPPTYVHNIVVDVPEVSGFGYFAVYGEFIQDSHLNIGAAHDLGYGGVIARSAHGVTSHVRRLYDVTPGREESYGIQFDRRDHEGDVIRYPHSTECVGRIDVIRRCATMNALGTHGGRGIDLSWGAAYGVKRVLDIVSATGVSGPGYAPRDVSFRGGYAHSGRTDGGGEPAVTVAGAFNTSTNTVVEHASGISGSIGTLVGYGRHSDGIDGAVYAHSTRGLDISIGNVREPSPFAVTLTHNNVGFSVQIGSVTDAWSGTLARTGMVNAPATNNTGVILSGTLARGLKAAAHVNTCGVYVLSSPTNHVRLAPGVDLGAATTATAGPIGAIALYGSALIADGSATAPSLALASEPGTGFFKRSVGDIGFASGGVLQMRMGPGYLIYSEGFNLDFGTVTGSRIGVAANRKLGFWGADPVVRPAALSNATDAATAVSQLNALLGRLRTIGLIAT